MTIIITGGGGFLGRRLAANLLARDHISVRGEMRTIDKIVLIDRAIVDPPADPRIVTVIGDIAEPGFLAGQIGRDCALIYHLAAVVSGEAEADFELGLRVNIDASRLLLDAARRAGHRPQMVFTSSVAVFGPSNEGAAIGDETAVAPLSSYGMEKAVAELMLADYARRGFVDGVVLRLPTISVRPGAPNKAASSFVSDIVREPLSGLPTVCPVPTSTRVWLLSPRGAVDALVMAAGLHPAQLGTQRVVNLPGLSVTVAEMIAALAAATGPEAVHLIRHEIDPAIERIVGSWPRAWDTTRATALGFRGDADLAAIIAAYIEEERPRAVAAA